MTVESSPPPEHYTSGVGFFPHLSLTTSLDLSGPCCSLQLDLNNVVIPQALISFFTIGANNFPFCFPGEIFQDLKFH